MSKLKLTLACGDYDFLRPLYDGTVAASGIDLNVLTMPSPERHGRMLRHEEFDVCELSLVGYLVARDQGCNYAAIPVFPHRRFRHSYMVKRTGCGIESHRISTGSGWLWIPCRIQRGCGCAAYFKTTTVSI